MKQSKSAVPARRTLVLLITVLLVVTSGCLWMRAVKTGFPWVDIQVRGDRQKPVFGFQTCSDPSILLELTSISVTLVTEHGEELVCGLRLRDHAAKKVTGSWEYSAESEGYTLEGLCKPLAPSQSYKVSAFGNGMGGRRFRIGPQGEVFQEGQGCK